AAAAAARARLDHDGVADVGGHAGGLGHVADLAVGAGDDGDAGRAHGVLRHALVAHLADGAGPGPDEDEVVVGADGGELGVLGEEPVAGVDGVGAGDLGGGDDPVHPEVALRGGRRPDADGLVGEADGERVAVGRGVDGDGPEAHLAAGADDAEGDLAPVRDEDLLDHGGWRMADGGWDGAPDAPSPLPHHPSSMTKSGWSCSTGSALPTRIWRTVPACSLWISFISFIASMMQRTSPGATVSPTFTKGSASGAGAA